MLQLPYVFLESDLKYNTTIDFIVRLERLMRFIKMRIHCTSFPQTQLKIDYVANCYCSKQMFNCEHILHSI